MKRDPILWNKRSLKLPLLGLNPNKRKFNSFKVSRSYDIYSKMEFNEWNKVRSRDAQFLSYLCQSMIIYGGGPVRKLVQGQLVRGCLPCSSAANTPASLSAKVILVLYLTKSCPYTSLVSNLLQAPIMGFQGRHVAFNIKNIGTISNNRERKRKRLCQRVKEKHEIEIIKIMRERGENDCMCVCVTKRERNWEYKRKVMKRGWEGGEIIDWSNR